MLTRNKPRTPARRGSLLASIAAGTYQARAARMAVIGAEVARPKVQPVRDEAYRRFVAGLPCFACGVQGYSQAAHPDQGRGLGQKASDRDVFPLCCARPLIVGCHATHDSLIGMTLAERRAREADYIARMAPIAAAAGWTTTQDMGEV